MTLKCTASVQYLDHKPYPDCNVQTATSRKKHQKCEIPNYMSCKLFTYWISQPNVK